MKTYTVILLRPDYVADVFGQDTYMTHVMAPTVPAAQAAAQREVVMLDFAEEAGDTEQDILDAMTDYFVVAVIEGKHTDVKNSE